MSAKQFLFEKRRFTDLFGTLDEATVKCIATGLLAMQNDHKQFAYGSWYADCNGNEYFFSYQGGRWLFTGYENINE